MKSVPLIDAIRFRVDGAIRANAICFGDVTNDGEIELCIGNSKGCVQIYKGLHKCPWRIAHNCGDVTAMAAGDLFNNGEQVLVVISGEGDLKVFNLKPEYDLSIAAEFEDDESGFVPIKIRKCYDQQLPPNIKKAEIVDVDDDGQNELLVTLTDRVVRTYRWSGFEELSESDEGEKETSNDEPKVVEEMDDDNAENDNANENVNDSINEEEEEENESSDDEAEESFDNDPEGEKKSTGNGILSPEESSMFEKNFQELKLQAKKINDSMDMRGELVSCKKWEFGGQVGGTSVGKCCYIVFIQAKTFRNYCLKFFSLY